MFRLNQIYFFIKNILTNTVSYDTLFAQTEKIRNGGIPMNQTDNAIKYLASCFLFEGIPPTAAERYLRNCELSVRDYRSGEIICSPTEDVGGLKTVLSGRAVVTGAGGSDAVLRTIEPGGIFGAAELFRPESESYISVIRAKCATKVLTVGREDVERLIIGNTVIASNYIRFLSGRVRFLGEKIAAFTAGSTERRLSCALRELPCDSDGVLTMPKMTELARMIGVGRASLYRALRSLEESGGIERGEDGSYRIPDRKNAREG